MNLEVISVNIWQILISLCNLAIIFLIVKKLLYKPVMGVLEKRRSDIASDYAEADKAKMQALSDKEEYEKRLASAESDADELRRAASAEAKRHEEKLISEARERADGIIRRAEEEIRLERLKAASDIKREIADASALIAEKLMKKELDGDTQRKLIDSFIEDMEGANE